MKNWKGGRHAYKYFYCVTIISMLKIEDYCTKEIVRVNHNESFQEVLRKFLGSSINIGCVLNSSGQLIGIISKNAILRSILNGYDKNTIIESFIKKNVVTVHKDKSLDDARNIMLKEKVAHGVVIDNDRKVVGVISKADIIQGFLSEKEYLVNQLSGLVANLDDSVISIDSNGTVNNVNLAAEDLFKVKVKNVIGTKIQNSFPEISTNLLKTFKYNSKERLKRLQLKDKTIIASFIPIQIKNKTIGAMAVLKDITIIEQIASELEYTKNLKQTLNQALSQSYDAIAIINQQGFVSQVNKSFMELFQIKKSIENKHWSQCKSDISVNEVLKGKRIDGEVKVINGHACIIYQEPIIRSGKIQGAIIKIIYRQLDEWKDVINQLEQLESEVQYYKNKLEHVTMKPSAFDKIITNNKEMENIKRQALLVSDSVSTVLITGESGTGKEIFAEAIHRESGRTGNFVKINCAAIPSELLEAELFGYAEGAFTGAKKGGKMGKFELANKGTLFLDEIGDMPLLLQAKILRVLQEKKIERIGENKTRTVDVRILAATNQNLKKMVQDGTFREDLYYRIDVVSFHLPPLRERIDDLPILCKHLIKKLNKKLNKNVYGVTTETLNIFESYHWPGNIRQLENILERAMNIGAETWIYPQHLPDELRKNSLNNTTVSVVESNNTTLEEIEKQAIINILKKTDFNRSKAAKELGISRSGLYKKMKKYGIKTEISIK